MEGLPSVHELEVALFERQGPVAIVTLNRPDRLNALNWEMHRDLLACFEEINEDPEIRAAVVTGAGRFFCAGRDIKEFVGTYGDGPGKGLRPLDDPNHPLFGRHAANATVRKPLVGAWNGPAVGGGLSVSLLFDMIVMADNAYAADLHAKVNVSALTNLMKFMPVNIARELIMSDRRLTPEECLRWGLVNHVVPPAEVLPTAVRIATTIAGMGPDSIRRAKEVSLQFQREMGMFVDEASLEAKRRSIDDQLAREQKDPDLMEGMRATLDRRTAEFVKPVG